MASLVVSAMEEEGTTMLRGCVPTAIERLVSGQLRVDWRDDEDGSHADCFDTVLIATGNPLLCVSHR